MKDFLFIIQIILIVGIIFAGITFVIWKAFTLNQISEEAKKERYFQCLDKTEKITCDKIFYYYQTVER